MAKQVKEEKGIETNLYTKVKVIGTGKVHTKKGEEYIVHPLHARAMLANGEIEKFDENQTLDSAPKDLRALDSQEPEK